MQQINSVHPINENMMAKPNSVNNLRRYSLWFLVLITSSSAAAATRQLPREETPFNECQLDTIDALEPDSRIESEAGLTETWDANKHPELRCAGVSVLKRTINANGLHLPSYVSYPELHFIQQGTGVMGVAIPGCAETYEEPQWEKGGRPQQQQQDRHQKVSYVKQGDLIAIPPSVPYWTYNYADAPLVIISLLDTSNKLNQLDRIPTRFYLAGNPEAEHAETEQKRGHPPHHHHEDEEEKEGNNMFSGFDSDFLSQVLKVKDSTIRKIQSPDDNNRKQIIKVKGGLSIIRPPLKPSEAREEEEEEETRHESGGRRRRHGEKRVEEEEEEEEEVEEEPTGRRKHREWRRERTHRKGEREGEGEEEEEEVVEEETETKTRGEHGERRTRDSRGEKSNYINNNNALDQETICTLKLQENIADPSRADVFNPRAGRITTANSLSLPVLKRLHLSAQWVNLYKNGIFVPHWNMNANSVIYVTRGRGRIQVVNFNGKSVFNGEVKRGQLLVVPQNFAVAKQAGKEGLEYIAFKTNDRAEISTMVGRDSAISATPAEVLAHAFGLTLQEVNALKNNRNEGVLATPDSRIPDDDHYITTVV